MEDEGIKVGWTGYNGTDYSTELITWEEMENKNYRFDISDYFDENNADLFPNGNKLFTFNVNIGVEEGATLQQIKDSLDGLQISSGYGITLSGNNGADSTRLGDSVYVESGSLNYNTAYDLYCNSKYDFDQTNDNPFIVPNKIANNGQSNLTSYPDPAITVEEAKNSKDTWSFSFNMDGIGIVTATSTSVSYYSSDYDTIWWNEYRGDTHYSMHTRTILGGTLENVMDTLTGARTDATPGLLTASKSGGHISLNFTLRDTGGSIIGDFSIGVSVAAGEKESDVLGKITGALNQNTVVNLYTTASSDRARLYSITLSSGEVYAPVYGQTMLQGKEKFWVQAGAEAGQHIDIEYESLSLWALGMQDTDTLTVESASRAIDEVKGALQIVSEQRSLFGAYQNRLEHAYNINKNVEENTQASESLIRDTDIADAMMEFSINNILLQAGTSMLTQANQSSQLITQLLG